MSKNGEKLVLPTGTGSSRASRRTESSKGKRQTVKLVDQSAGLGSSGLLGSAAGRGYPALKLRTYTEAATSPAGHTGAALKLHRQDCRKALKMAAYGETTSEDA